MKNTYLFFYATILFFLIQTTKISSLAQKKNSLLKNFSNTSIETVKSFWNNRPCNIRHSSKEIGSQDYFDEVEHKKYFVEPHIPKFAEFSTWSEKKVLEIGCGIGTESINFARAKALLTIVELSEKSLNITKNRFDVFGLHAELYQGNAEHLESILPATDIGSFDLVWSFGVIHHTPHPEKIIKGIKKFIKKGGELRIMLYSKISYKLFSIMREINFWDFSNIDSIISKYSEAQVGCPVTYTYTKESVLKLLGSGWDNISIIKTHIFPYKIDKYIKNQYEKEDVWKNVSEELFQEFENELGWHYLVKATFIGE